MIESADIMGRTGQRRGFTLLEVVTAVFVFLVGVVGAISLYAAASSFHEGARDKTLTALLIDQVVAEIEERLHAGEFEDAGGALQTRIEGAISGSTRYGYRATFTSLERQGLPLIQARVEVTWKDKGAVRGQAFDYLFRPGPEWSAP